MMFLLGQRSSIARVSGQAGRRKPAGRRNPAAEVHTKLGQGKARLLNACFGLLESTGPRVPGAQGHHHGEQWVVKHHGHVVGQCLASLHCTPDC